MDRGTVRGVINCISLRERQREASMVAEQAISAALATKQKFYPDVGFTRHMRLRFFRYCSFKPIACQAGGRRERGNTEDGRPTNYLLLSAARLSQCFLWRHCENYWRGLGLNLGFAFRAGGMHKQFLV